MATPQGRAILQGYDQQAQQGLTNRLALRRQQLLEEQEARQGVKDEYTTLVEISKLKNKALRNMQFDRFAARAAEAGKALPPDFIEAYKKSSLAEGEGIAQAYGPLLEKAGFNPTQVSAILEGGDLETIKGLLEGGLKVKKAGQEEEEAQALQRIQAGGTLGEVSGVQAPAVPPAADQRPRGYVEGQTTQPIIGSEKLTPTFTAKVTEVATRLNMNPQDLLRIISFETGGTFNPAERNRAGSGATGLIQFTRETAKALGTTTDALAKMSPEEQLDYVEKYLTPYKGKLGNLKDAYLAVLKPAALGQGLDAPLFTRDKDGLAYRQNAGLDTSGKGQVTVGDALAAVMRTTTGGGTLPAAPDTRMQVAGPGAPAPTTPAPSAADSADLTRLKQAIAAKRGQIQQLSGLSSERANKVADNMRADLKILQDQHDRLEDRQIKAREQAGEPQRALEKQQVLQPGELEKAREARALTPIPETAQKSLAANKSIYRSIGKVEQYFREGTDLPEDFVNQVAQDAPGIRAALQADPKGATGILEQWETKLKAAAKNDPNANRFLAALANMRDLVIRERSGGSVTGNELERAMGAFMGSLPNINQAFSLFVQNLANIKETVVDELVTAGASARPLAGGKAVYGSLPKEVRDAIDAYERGEEPPKATRTSATTTVTKPPPGAKLGGPVTIVQP
jgi:hypothetical protein